MRERVNEQARGFVSGLIPERVAYKHSVDIHYDLKEVKTQFDSQTSHQLALP